MFKRIAASAFLSLLFGTTIAYAQNTTVQPETNAHYSVTFQSTWSDETHPGVPTGAHFSPLIGATHNVSATFWESGTVASLAIEQMAETGGTSLFLAEIEAQNVDVFSKVEGSGLSDSPGEVTITNFSVNRDYPLVTLVTMIAPSPDWFIGVHGLPLLDDEGEWVDTLTVTLYPYDAGTDDGGDYTSPDIEANPHQNITKIQGKSPFSNQPIGSFTFTRVRTSYLPLVYR